MSQQGEERARSGIADFLAAYLYNLIRHLIALALAVGLVAFFALVVYRETIPIFEGMAQFIIGLLIKGNLWPVFLFLFLLSAWPRRVRRRRGRKPAAAGKKPASSRPAGGQERGGR